MRDYALRASILDSTPFAALTVGEFRTLIGDELRSVLESLSNSVDATHSGPGPIYFSEKQAAAQSD